MPYDSGTNDSTPFVTEDPLTVAELLATYPAGPALVGKYARVSDLFSEVDEVMRCSRNGTSFYWRPQRTDYAKEMPMTGGAMSLVPLVSPPIVFLTGTMLATGNVTPSTANAWPGMTFKVVSAGVLGLFGISLSGLIGGTLPLLQGGAKTLTFTGAGFRAD